MKKIIWLPIILLGLSTLALLVLFVQKAIGYNRQLAKIDQTQTAAVATNWALETIAAIPTETPTPTPTETPTLTPTPTVTETPEPSPTEEPPTEEACYDEATFIDDITIPDGTELEPDTPFTKTWRLLNAGTCTWTPNYKLIFVSGDQMSGPSSQQMVTVDVPPGASIDVSVDLEAPSTPDTYRGYWGLRSADGVRFGIGPAASSFYLEIEVVEGGE
jgi:hypothetical protein